MGKIFTANEVQSHNSRHSCWIVIKNDVYDVTKYLLEHPGGEDPILDAAGMDATMAFEDVGHSSSARKKLKQFKIGSMACGEKCVKRLPRLWTSSGQTITVYRCENDGKPRRLADSSSNRSSPDRSMSPSMQNCSKCAISLRDPSAKVPSSSKLSASRSRSTVASKCSGCTIPKTPPAPPKTPPVQLPMRRVPSIVVPLESDSGGSNLKWALLALAVAIIAGVAYKKYAA